jgi:hypothetical protein
MNRAIRLALAVVFPAVLPAVASAQFVQPPGSYVRPYQPSRPTVSPYLNINRGGTSPAINYYGIVRPQVQTQQDFQQVQQQLTAQAAVGPGPETAMPLTTGSLGATPLVSTTGHPVSYFNYSHYFPGILNRGGMRTGVSGGISAGQGGGLLPPVVGVGLGTRRR